MNIKKLSLGLCTAVGMSVLVLGGCSKSEAPSSTATAPATTETRQAPAPPATAPAPATVSEDAGSITGKVSFSGAAPSMKMISMVKEKSCDEAHKAKPQHEETVVVNPNKTLRYVVVYIKDGLKGKSFTPPAPVTLDQKTCWYSPHVVGVMTGQTINVINSDSGVLHNIHFMPKMNPPLNFGQPGPAPGGTPPSRTVVFNKAEVIPVKCDVHAWMHAWVAVADNPFIAVTDDSGTFTLKDVPPGTYTIEAWHEKYGTQDMKVTVGKKAKKTVNFNFK